jgi:DNA polymerase III gamma/tau subunit
MRLGDFGQPRVEALLDEMLARGRANGSLLFQGPPGVGKEALAVELGRVLNCELGGRCPAKPPFARGGEPAEPATRCDSCHKFDRLQHPDLLLVFPVPKGTWDEKANEGASDSESKETTLVRILRLKAANPYFRYRDFDRPTNIEADVLRERVLPMVYSRPVEGRVKTIVISDAEQTTKDISNVLLKTLEEPPENCLLVLATSVPEGLPSTIVSRCQRLRFDLLAPEWMEPRLPVLMQSLGVAREKKTVRDTRPSTDTRPAADAEPAKARLAAQLGQGSMVGAMLALEDDLQKIRDLAFEILGHAAAGRLLELLETAAALAHEHSKRRHLVPLLFQTLAVVARDVLLVAEGVADTGTALANADRARDVRALAAEFDPAALHAVLRGVASAERQIAGHAVVEHALAAFFLGLAPSAPEAAGGGRKAGRR